MAKFKLEFWAKSTEQLWQAKRKNCVFPQVGFGPEESPTSSQCLLLELPQSRDFNLSSYASKRQSVTHPLHSSLRLFHFTLSLLQFSSTLILQPPCSCDGCKHGIESSRLLAWWSSITLACHWAMVLPSNQQTKEIKQILVLGSKGSLPYCGWYEAGLYVHLVLRFCIDLVWGWCVWSP